MRAIVLTAAAVIGTPTAMLVSGSSQALAKGTKSTGSSSGSSSSTSSSSSSSAQVLTGQESCNLVGTFSFSPKLKSKSHRTTTVTFTGKLKGCTSSATQPVTITGGTVHLATPATASADCDAVLADGDPLPTMTGKVVWKPSSAGVAPSQITLTGGYFDELPTADTIVWSVPAGGGQVGTGSFVGPFVWAASPNGVTANTPATAVLAQCPTEVTSLAFGTGKQPMPVTIGTASGSSSS